MKNKRFFAGILGFTLVFGLTICGCPTDSDGGGGNVIKFEGVWRSPNGSHQTYTFTGNTVVRTADAGQTWSATFVFTDTTITFTPTSGSSWTQNYTLSESVLSINADGSHPYGSFLIQKTGATKFEGTWKNSHGTRPAYTFTNNRVVYSDNDGNTGEGVFAFTDASITFIRSSTNSWT
jgi:hypothetical protein